MKQYTITADTFEIICGIVDDMQSDSDFFVTLNHEGLDMRFTPANAVRFFITEYEKKTVIEQEKLD